MDSAFFYVTEINNCNLLKLVIRFNHDAKYNKITGTKKDFFESGGEIPYKNKKNKLFQIFFVTLPPKK